MINIHDIWTDAELRDDIDMNEQVFGSSGTWKSPQTNKKQKIRQIVKSAGFTPDLAIYSQPNTPKLVVCKTSTRNVYIKLNQSNVS